MDMKFCTRSGLFGLCLYIFTLLKWSFAIEDVYREELIITRLPTQQLAAQFRFSVNRAETSGNNYDLFPKMIGELVESYDLEEFHLSLSQGLWRHDQWGYAPHPAVPTGAQVWAWFGDNVTEPNSKWRDFIHALSGQFCASLSQLDPTMTARPEWGFRPAGFVAGDMSGNTRIRYAALPRENVCTENLTPWKKLLPCKNRGISELLTGHKLYETHYHSLAVDVRRTCETKSCVAPGLEIVQTLTIVFDAGLEDKSTDYTLRWLFGKAIESSCSLATSSYVIIDQTNPEKIYPEPDDTVKLNGRSYARYNLARYFDNQLVASPDDRADLNSGSRGTHLVFGRVHSPPVKMHSYMAGTGQQSGRLVTRFENGLDKDVTGLFMYLVPWFLRIYFHTIEFRCSNGTSGLLGEPIKPLFKSFSPGKDREKAHFMELAIRLPPNSLCYISVFFEKLLLRWTEYPPDAHRGFSIPPAVFQFKLDNLQNATLHLGSDSTFSQRISRGKKADEWLPFFLYGESLLVNLPTPDFSMPYNVICLVCTVVALAFGPIYNLTTKSLVLKHPDQQQGLVAKIKTRLKAKASAVIRHFKGKNTETGDPTAEDNQKSDDIDATTIKKTE